jgi:hypothetical protein
MAHLESDDTDRYGELIRWLSADLVPVARLRPPVMRALWWIGAVVAAGAVLAPFSDLFATAERLKAVPDLWLASIGSMLTAALAAVAAFQLSFPDRSPKWALLPIPSVGLWVGASGLGCLRTWLVPGTHDASLAEAQTCFVFILGLSIPLSVLSVAMLRQAHSLWPNLTCALGGLAVAGASATVLNLFHPYDAAGAASSVVASRGARALGGLPGRRGPSISRLFENGYGFADALLGLAPRADAGKGEP